MENNSFLDRYRVCMLYRARLSIVARLTGFALLLATIFSCSTKDIIEYVNPFIGTANSLVPSKWEANGGTYPGAAWPFGMVQATPENYHYHQLSINAFSLINHTNGYPNGSSGNFWIMPFVPNDSSGSVDPRSKFSHEHETASPGFYSVFLEDYGILAEMTVSKRTSFFRFHFTRGSSKNVLISDILEPKKSGDDRLTGKSGGYFFVLSTHPNIATLKLENDKALLQWNDLAQSELLVKISFSKNSISAAIQNQNDEIGDWDFDRAKRTAQKKWRAQLGQIVVEGGTDDQSTIFYTALYHTLLDPHLISDSHEPDRFSGLSPWDTYRFKQPLIALLHPAKQSEMIKSVLDVYDKNGMMNPGPMTGMHNIPIIADSYFKGIDIGNPERAYAAMRQSLFEKPYARPDIASYWKYGYVPADISYSVTKTVEYSYDCWAMAGLARALEKPDDYQFLIEKSHGYRHLFNADTKFLAARSLSGRWAKGGFREGDQWAYLWSAQQDIQDMINLAGGKEEFTRQLDQCFVEGNYFHDNEPPLHQAYLYCYAGKPWKTQQQVNKIMVRNYANNPGGLSGNDDLGALSAWYVFSALGIYPVTPGVPEYVLGAPVFDKVTIHLENGKTFTIETANNSDENIYVNSIALNGIPYNNLFLKHQDILRGGTLTFTKSSAPDTTQQYNRQQLPYSLTKAGPDLELDKWEVESKKVAGGQPIHLFLTIKNAKKLAGSMLFTVQDNDSTIHSQWLLAKPEMITKQQLEVTIYRPGVHKISLNHQTPVLVEVTPNPKPDYVYGNLSFPSPPICFVGSAVNFGAKIQYSGSYNQQKTVKLFENGIVMDRQQLTFSPGARLDITFKHTFPKEGIYQMAIDDQTAQPLLVYGPNYHPDESTATLKPVIYYNFNDGNAKVIKDHSGNGNNAVVINDVKWVDSIFGKAIKTDAGQDAYVQIPAPHNPGKIGNGHVLTLMFWVYPMDEENFADILSKGDLNVIQIRASNHEVNFYSGGWQRGEAYAEVPENWNRHWHHVAGVSSEDTLKLFIDGQLAATKVIQKDKNYDLNTTLPWNIGRNAQNPGRLFRGYIDEVKIFDQSLTNDEIVRQMMEVQIQ